MSREVLTIMFEYIALVVSFLALISINYSSVAFPMDPARQRKYAPHLKGTNI